MNSTCQTAPRSLLADSLSGIRVVKPVWLFVCGACKQTQSEDQHGRVLCETTACLEETPPDVSQFHNSGN